MELGLDSPEPPNKVVVPVSFELVQIDHWVWEDRKRGEQGLAERLSPLHVWGKEARHVMLNRPPGAHGGANLCHPTFTNDLVVNGYRRKFAELWKARSLPSCLLRRDLVFGTVGRAKAFASGVDIVPTIFRTLPLFLFLPLVFRSLVDIREWASRGRVRTRWIGAS